ncbi:hypothetical protein [Paractinoplanes lichenicola]|uniref:Uncharacterized protein n=1 Tax=Paractinoplanes lichenicola TaxID=2802976 RepID=A0ABS1VU82_9ACTN|nr:hypothetical protein [Actinoplanes lichenicola]MBL7258038.1 hypothetical protein [Actinoplanes lichenicola]
MTDPGPMPPAHRAFRVAALLVVVAVTLFAGFSGSAAAAVRWAGHGVGQVTAYLWQPLLHGGGWAGPLQPAPSPSPSVKPKPKPKKTAKPKPKKSPTKKS